MQNSTAGVKITSPATSQKVPVGQLIVLGTSTDNSTTDCQVYVDLNDIKPMQNTTAAGAGGQQDYSNWTFTYTSKYRLIAEGVNELTAKLSCIDNPANVTKYYSVNVTGVAAPTDTNNTTTTTSNAALKNVTTENNNQPELSTDTVNQTQKQTLQIQSEPKQELQTEPSTDSVPQPLKEAQQEEAQPESIPYDKNSKSFTSEVEPLGDSPYSSDELSEGSNEAVEVEKSTELVEPAMELPKYASDQVQIDEEELQPMETQSQPQETLEQRATCRTRSGPRNYWATTFGRQSTLGNNESTTRITRTTAFGNFRVQPTNGGPTSRELQSGNTTITIRNTTS